MQIYIVLFQLLLTFIESSIISEQLEAYKKLLRSDKLTPQGLQTLYRIHDNDSICLGPCYKHIENYLGKDGLDWDKLKEVLEETYANISYDPYEPQEIHLALTDSLSEMKVMWTTMKNLENPFVEYTRVENDWNDVNKVLKANAVNDTYTVPYNWYPVFNGVIYETNMIQLIPNKQSYKYRVGGFDIVNNTIRRSKDYIFKTAPNTNIKNQKNTFAMLGDQGTFMVLGFTVTDKLIKLQDELGIDILHYAGDLSYAGMSTDLTPFNNIEEDDEFGHIWDLWGIQNEPLAATKPFMLTPGNHESFYNYTAFNHRYHMPHIKSNGNGNYWFSYDYGNVHIISISTEESFALGSPQMVWVEQDIIKAVNNRDNVPWIVLSLHRPMYCSDEGQNNYAERTINLEPLLIQYDIDLVIQGHMHAYERIHPVQKEQVTLYPVKRPNGEGKLIDVYHSDNKGPIYVVQGNTGAMQVETWVQPKPDYSAIRFANGFIPPNIPDHNTLEAKQNLKGILLKSNYTDTFGFGVATFHNSTHLHYSNIPVTGTIGVDEFWIIKRTKL